MTRAVVIGGGPAGSDVARRMAGGGIDVTLLDRTEFPRDKACGEFLGPIAVSELRDAGLIEGIRAAGGEWVERVVLVFPSGRRVGGPVGPAEDPVRGLTISRRTLDSALISAAREAGARVLERFRVQRVDRDGSGWSVAGTGPGGEPRTVTADLLIGADGAVSGTARRMGWVRRAWPHRMGISADFAGWPVDEATLEMHLLPDAYCGVVGRNGAAHVGLAFRFRKGEWPPGRTPGEVLHERLAAFPGVRARIADAAPAGAARAFGPMSVRTSRRAGDALMLVGDAAGFLDPITGHGIGFALRSARLAAETAIAAAAAGNLSDLRAYPRAYARELGPSSRLYASLQAVLSLPAPLLSALGRQLESRPDRVEQLIRRVVADPSSRGESTIGAVPLGDRLR